MGDSGSDEIGYGDDATSRWPRHWLIAATVIAVLAAALGWRQRDARPPTAVAGTPVTAPPTAPAVMPTPSPTPQPPTFEGPLLQDGLGAQVVLGGRRPAVVDLPSGRSTPITGLPSGIEVISAVRISGATILMVGDPSIGEVYSLPDGTTVARPLGFRGAGLMPGETDNWYWVLASGWDPEHPRATVEERDGSGRLVRRVKLPKNWQPVRGVTDGILMISIDQDPEVAGLAVWDPGRRRIVRSFGHGIPIATAVDMVAWPDRTCRVTAESCLVHVTDLHGGADRVVAIPGHAHMSFGYVSPDGSSLVLSSLTRDDSQRLVAVSLDTGHVVPIAVAAPPSAASMLDWTPDGTAAILFAGDADDACSLAVWRRDAERIELIPARFQGCWPLAVRPSG